MERIFMDIFVKYDNTIEISLFSLCAKSFAYGKLNLCTVPPDYNEKQCYLCDNAYEGTVKPWELVIYETKYKKTNEELYTCRHCVHQNWHEHKEWTPYIINSIDSNQ